MRNIIGQPVKGEDFFERPKLIKKIHKTLDAKLPVLLTGPKKSGKTSILQFLSEHLMEYYAFFYIDADSIFDIHSYYDTLWDKLCNPAFLSHIRSKTGEIADADDVIGLIRAYIGKRPLVIMVDDFSGFLEKVYRDDGPEVAARFLKVDQEFRSHFGKGIDDARFIYTSSINLGNIANKIDVSQSINDLYPIGIPPFSDKEAREFIQALTESEEFDLDSGQIRYICEKIQWLNPFHIQLIFFELGSIYLDNDLTEITNSTIDEALGRLLKHKDYIEPWQRDLQTFPSSQEYEKVKKEFKKIKIEKIKIQHIKCFEDVDITFEPSVNTTVLIGTNGKGKSTILQLIALGLSGINNVPFPYNWKDVVKKNSPQGFFEIDVLFDNKPIHLKFEIDSKDDSITCIEGTDQLESIRDTFMLLAYGVNRSIKLEETKPYKAIEPIATLFGENGYLKHIKISANYEYVRQDQNFKTIQALINKVLQEANGDEKVILTHYDSSSFYFTTPSNPDKSIPIEALSEGFKSTLVWLFDAIIRIVEKGGSLENASEITGVILLDEVDLHLHPTWQRTILQSVENLFPNIQFIVTTHSPFVVQSAKKECLIALEMEKGSDNVIVVDKNITSELSYNAIVREIFNIRFPFSRELEQKMDEFRQLQADIRDNKEINEKQFKALIKEIASKGVELEGIMRRELRGLEQRTGKTFNLWKE